ncbi:hypothetical protein JTB14_005519 [Gonioctena quinquepunctata]|nr:hypothetical protein JTB14_005519 [Gonioctena quinquepunctata]
MHLEVVSDLTTECFISASRRFVSRRGLCNKIVSDNGSNFVGAKAQLKKILLESDETIKMNLSQDGISWSFIPPRAPNFGGLWESGVKSVKYPLKRIVGETSVTFEELTTLAIQIESCLNSRPLYALSTDPNDPSPLTPAHFLIGDKLTAVPDSDWLSSPSNRLCRFQHIQKMMQHFWSRWAKEYVSNSQVRTKWKKNHPQLLKLGTFVLVKEDGHPPLKWLMGRVVQLFPGADSDHEDG